MPAARTQPSLDQLTGREKIIYLSGILDAADLPNECLVLCKQLLAELAMEIEGGRKGQQGEL